MSPENGTDRKKKGRYTFVVLPAVDSDKTRTFSASPLGIIGTVTASFLVIVILIFAAIIYTPLGSSLPIANPELEQQYTGQIADIQGQINTLLDQMSVLRSYNLRLRQVMGEQIQGEDSSLLVSKNNIEQFEKPKQEAAETVQQKSFNEQAQSKTSSRVGSAQYQDMRLADVTSLIDISLSAPFEGFTTRGFEPDRFHYGIDFAGKQGSPILAAAEGNVVFAGWTYDDGMMMMVAHHQGYLTVYKHNKALLKQVGSTVRRGEMIALLGNTGKSSSGPHLHFEVWRDGIATDPMNYLMLIQ